MSYPFPPDVSQRVKSQLAKGSFESEDEVLRAAMSALERENEDLAAIWAGIEDMEAGRYRPFSEVDAEIRKKFNIV